MANEKIKTLHLFAGIGGGILGDIIVGNDPIAAVEIDPFSCSVLRSRSPEWWPNLTVHECDIRSFDASEYAGRVDCISAGWPCQDISPAGRRRGITGPQSSLWSEVVRCANEVRPRYLFLENSSSIIVRGFDAVLCDLAAMGFDAEWCCISSEHIGAPHSRDRWWLLASHSERGQRGKEPHGRKARRMGRVSEPLPWHGGWEDALATVRGMDDGSPRSVHRTDAIRNAQIPLHAATAFSLLMNRLANHKKV